MTYSDTVEQEKHVIYRRTRGTKINLEQKVMYVCMYCATVKQERHVIQKDMAYKKDRKQNLRYRWSQNKEIGSCTLI